VDGKDASRLAALVQARLGGDGRAAASLLEAAAREASAASDTRSRPAAIAAAADAPALALGGSGSELLVLPSLSFVVPRGRFDLVLSTDGIALRGKGGAVTHGPVAYGDIKHVLRLPKSSASYRRAGTPAPTYLLILALQVPLTVGKQALGCLVVNADGTKPFAANRLSEAAKEPNLSGAAGRIIVAATRSGEGEAEHEALGRLLVAGPDLAVQEPDPKVCPVDWVRAYRGVDDGALYPLAVGLCFLTRPALFIPTEDIAAITSGRDGDASVHAGASTTDLVVERRPGTGPSEVFSHIARADVLALTSGYLRAARAAHRRDGSGAEAPAGVAGGMEVEEQDDDDDEEKDEDYDDNEEEDEEEEDENEGDDEDEQSGGEPGDAEAGIGASSASAIASSCSAPAFAMALGGRRGAVQRRHRPPAKAPEPVAKRTRRAVAATAAAVGSGAELATLKEEELEALEALEGSDEEDDDED